MSEVEIAKVVEVFEARKAKWALVGAHAIALLTEPRATSDFDFIVEASKLDSIVADLTDAFGDLDEHDIGAAMRLTAIDIDLIRSTRHPLFREALRHLRTVGSWKVPETEVLLVLKFLAATSPARAANRRGQDVLDLRVVYQAVGDELDRERAIKLSRKVYPGAEREFRELLDKIDRNEPLTI